MSKFILSLKIDCFKRTLSSDSDVFAGATVAVLSQDST